MGEGGVSPVGDSIEWGEVKCECAEDCGGCPGDAARDAGLSDDSFGDTAGEDSLNDCICECGLGGSGRSFPLVLSAPRKLLAPSTDFLDGPRERSRPEDSSLSSTITGGGGLGIPPSIEVRSGDSPLTVDG